MSSASEPPSRSRLPDPAKQTAPRPPSVHSLPNPASGTAQPEPEKNDAALTAGPVRNASLRLRHFLMMLSFVLVVIVPTGLGGFYLWTVAVDQYASKVGFSVRREDASSATDVLAGLTAFSGSSSTDTDILYEFLQSQRLVSEIDEEIDLRSRWSKPEEDIVFALDPESSIEDLM